MPVATRTKRFELKGDVQIALESALGPKIDLVFILLTGDEVEGEGLAGLGGLNAQTLGRDGRSRLHALDVKVAEVSGITEPTLKSSLPGGVRRPIPAGEILS